MASNLRWMCVASLAGFLLPLALGCGSDAPLARQAVSGEVKLDGAPLDQGIIEFSPEDGTGLTSGATLQSGRYAIDGDNGLPPGKYRVRLYSAGATPELPPGPPGPPSATIAAAAERIPPQYNSKSTEVVEVVLDGPNTFSFDLHSKSSR